MACLPTIYHLMLYMCLRRMLTTPLLYPLRANNLSLGMHMLLNPWGRHMKYPETTLWPTSSLTPDMPPRGKHLVAYPSQTSWGALNITHNRNYNPYIFR